MTSSPRPMEPEIRYFFIRFLFFYIMGFLYFVCLSQAWVEDSVIAVLPRPHQGAASENQHSVFHDVGDLAEGPDLGSSDDILYACFENEGWPNGGFRTADHLVMPVSYLTTGTSVNTLEVCSAVGVFQIYLDYVASAHDREIVNVAANTTSGTGLATRTLDNTGFPPFTPYLSNVKTVVARETSLSNGMEMLQVYKIRAVTTVLMPTILMMPTGDPEFKMAISLSGNPDTTFFEASIIDTSLVVGLALLILGIIAIFIHLIYSHRAKMNISQGHSLYNKYREDRKPFGNVVHKVDTVKSIRKPPHLESTLYMDHGRILQFTWRPDTIKIGLGDRIKAVVEVCLRQPIIWWPLKPMRTYYSSNDLRVSWYCNCGDELYVDLPWQIASDYRRLCIRYISPSGAPSLLPLHNLASTSTTSSSLAGTQTVGQTSSSVTQRFSFNSSEPKGEGPGPRDAQQAVIISQVNKNCYIHWCVDVNRIETRLFHIPVPNMTDVTVISTLKSAYNAAGGFRRWFSLTACYSVKLVAFERVHRSKELVACGKEDLPCPTTNQDYVYTYVDPREQFIKTLEKSLMHHLHSPNGCGAQDIEDILKRIPKKTNGKLEMKFGAAGYGMYAVPGWAFWKLLVALGLTQIGPLIFAIRWLYGHPGDLQNAFILSFYLVGLLNLVVVVPDLWSMRK